MLPLPPKCRIMTFWFQYPFTFPENVREINNWVAPFVWYLNWLRCLNQFKGLGRQKSAPEETPWFLHLRRRFFSRGFGLPDFFSSFFSGKKCPETSSRKIPAKSSKNYTTKIPDTFLRRSLEFRDFSPSNCSNNLTCFHASFFPFCPLCWPPLLLSFSRHFFTLSPPRKVLFSVERRGHHRAWRGAVLGWTSPQISGRKFLPEICVKKPWGPKAH